MAARVKSEPAARRDQHDVPEALRPAGYDPPDPTWRHSITRGTPICQAEPFRVG
jgi:hypothetical protein